MRKFILIEKRAWHLYWQSGGRWEESGLPGWSWAMVLIKHTQACLMPLGLSVLPTKLRITIAPMIRPIARRRTYSKTTCPLSPLELPC
jgi:hypothetical protein